MLGIPSRSDGGINKSYVEYYVCGWYTQIVGWIKFSDNYAKIEWRVEYLLVDGKIVSVKGVCVCVTETGHVAGFPPLCLLHCKTH